MGRGYKLHGDTGRQTVGACPEVGRTVMSGNSTYGCVLPKSPLPSESKALSVSARLRCASQPEQSCLLVSQLGVQGRFSRQSRAPYRSSHGYRQQVFLLGSVCFVRYVTFTYRGFRKSTVHNAHITLCGIWYGRSLEAVGCSMFNNMANWLTCGWPGKGSVAPQQVSG